MSPPCAFPCGLGPPAPKEGALVGTSVPVWVHVGAQMSRADPMCKGRGGSVECMGIWGGGVSL